MDRDANPKPVAESDHEVAADDGWVMLRSKRYGRTVITTLERLP